MKCMYTTQLTKKRKTWSDGLLKVFFSGGSFQCSLLDAGKLRETVLVSRQLESLEVQQLKKNEEIELDFEGYLVTVSAGSSEHDESKVGPPLKLPKFVPPSRYVPPARQVDQYVSGSNNPVGAVPGTTRPAAASGPYRVTNDELDDIWDRDQPAPTHRTAPNVQFAADVEPPAFLMFSREQTGTNLSQSARFGQQNPSVRPVPTVEASLHMGPSVEASLRLTGANAGGDASQPALTRYFAAVPQTQSRAPQPVHEHQHVHQQAPQARPAYTTEYSAPLSNMQSSHARSNHHASVVQGGFTSSGTMRGYHAPTSAAPTSNSRNFPSDHYNQHQHPASNAPQAELVPQRAAVPSSYVNNGRAPGLSSAGGTFSAALAPPRAPEVLMERNPVPGATHATNATNSCASAPVAPALNQQPAVRTGTSSGFSAEGAAGGAAQAQAQTQGPPKTSYSSIISNSVWDSD